MQDNVAQFKDNSKDNFKDKPGYWIGNFPNHRNTTDTL